ncbi:MAG: response regulator [Chlorobiales bacterium]|nr:response regulator [Chlorobiales bacterium]
MPDQEENATILVVDDSALIRTMVSAIIKNLGYNPIIAEDGDECIEAINAHKIDLVLLDIHMPGKSGIEVLSYIRDHHLSIPVIMISGSSDIEEAVESLKMGAYDFLLKPVNQDRLTVTVKNALSEFELRQNLKLFSTAIEQNPLSITITDINGIIKYANPAFTSISGYDQKEVAGLNMNILKSGKQSKTVYKKLWKTITSGNIWQGELINKKKNGEFYWEYATISPITGSNNKISHFIGIKQDITQDKKKQAELEESEIRFQDMADLLPQPIFEIDLQGKITYTNIMNTLG